MTSALGLAFMVGVIAPGRNLALQILIVVWSGLVGMMIPRIVDARRGVRPRDGNQRVPPLLAPDQQTIDHDMAAALLTVEGGVTALRYMYNAAESPQVESITHAIETEIRRLRRLSLPQQSGASRCGIVDTIAPLIELHTAAGASIVTRLQCDSTVAMAGDDLARVVENLLDNCAHHAPGAEVSVEGDERGDQYRLVIHDEGPGIDRRLGEGAWRQGISTLPGGGLGLYSVRSTIESAGGQVCFDLTRSGTTIVLDLPIAAEDGGPIDGTWHPPPSYERAG